MFAFMIHEQDLNDDHYDSNLLIFNCYIWVQERIDYKNEFYRLCTPEYTRNWIDRIKILRKRQLS